MVDREGSFEELAGEEVAELFAGIRDASCAEEVALLAGCVPSGWGEFCGIDDGAGAWVGKVALDWAMTPFAGDGFGGEGRLAKCVEGAGDMSRAVPEWQKTQASPTGRVKSGLRMFS